MTRRARSRRSTVEEREKSRKIVERLVSMKHDHTHAPEATAVHGFSPGFAALGLEARLLATLEALGYEEPTPIQREAIPPLLAGKDVLGQAATGTGKTAAFTLPLLQRIAHSPKTKPSAIILVPTRELAIQVGGAVGRYGKELRTSVLPLYGGQSIGPQMHALKRGVDVIVATPGRALDHIRRHTLKLEGVQIVVLDEADEMLDMGFAEDLDAILEHTPAAKQTALFSATMPPRKRVPHRGCSRPPTSSHDHIEGRRSHASLRRPRPSRRWCFAAPVSKSTRSRSC
jgi:ATP-dependent RNA helicase DeaD